MCIHENMQCDGGKDCEGGEDEYGCPDDNSTYTDGYNDVYTESPHYFESTTYYCK